jgi:hypothetical protein
MGRGINGEEEGTGRQGKKINLSLDRDALAQKHPYLFAQAV